MRGFSCSTKDFDSKQRALFSKRMLSSKPLLMRRKLYFFERWHKIYFKDHPEYFAEVENKRVYDLRWNCNPCFSNDEVIRRFAGEIIELFKKYPNTRSIRFLSDNMYGPCQCKKCRTSKVRQVSIQDGHYSEEYFAFVQRVATIVFNVYPDRFFICNTKCNIYDVPPKTVKLDNRVIIDFLTRRYDPSAYFQVLENQLKKIDLWNKNGNPIYIKSYDRYPHFLDYPLMTHHYIAKFARLYKGHIMGITKTDLRKNPFVFSALNNYVQGKIIFNTNENVDGLVQKFVKHCYPGAEKEITGFYNVMENVWASKTEFSINPLHDIYTVKNLNKPREFLRQANNKLTGESYLLPGLTSSFEEFYVKSKAVDIGAFQRRKDSITSITVKNISQINVDGVISENEWKGASVTKLLPPPLTKTQGDKFQSSSAMVAHDGKYIYFALMAKESRMTSLKLSCTENGKGPIWSDDCFEIMVSPNGGNSYYQLMINANGVYRVLYYPKKGVSEDKDIGLLNNVKAIKNKDGYVIELRIPLKQITQKHLWRDWKFNIFRTRIATSIGRDKTRIQSSGLLLLGHNYHDIDNYITLKWDK